MNRAVAVFQNVAEVSLADAVSAATLNPAKLLKHLNVCSGLQAGQPANLVLFRPGPLSLEIKSSWLHGQCVFGLVNR